MVTIFQRSEEFHANQTSRESKMKKKTLNQTWKLCRRVSRWIAKPENEEISVHTLKKRWFHKNGFDNSVIRHCFFCDFTVNATGRVICAWCLRKAVSPNFHCCNDSYHYSRNRKAFYKELLRLNRIRKGKNGN